TEECTCVAVEDNGIGIPTAYQKNIFEMFYKTAPTKGTGLGLYIVRLLTEAMGGTVELDSEEGEGSTFILRLPRQSVTRA
ncbi:MAG: sensor histidine kinase, partial [Bacteroidota bacterium]